MDEQPIKSVGEVASKASLILLLELLNTIEEISPNITSRLAERINEADLSNFEKTDPHSIELVRLIIKGFDGSNGSK